MPHDLPPGPVVVAPAPARARRGPCLGRTGRTGCRGRRARLATRPDSPTRGAGSVPFGPVGGGGAMTDLVTEALELSARARAVVEDIVNQGVGEEVAGWRENAVASGQQITGADQRR